VEVSAEPFPLALYLLIDEGPEEIPRKQESSRCSTNTPSEYDRYCEYKTFDLRLENLSVGEAQDDVRARGGEGEHDWNSIDEDDN